MSTTCHLDLPAPRHTGDRRRLGDLGESLAAAHLEEDGLEVVARNWRLRAGELRGELDLVAVDRAGGLVVVCEVKTRRDAHRFDGALVAGEDVPRQPPGQPALLFRGTIPVNGGAGLPIGDGLRCAGGQVKRLVIAFSQPDGSVSFGPGLAPSGGWQPGDTMRFQTWYRDPQGPCAQGFNTTSAVEAHFEP